ncbi:transcription factor Sox-3-like [Leptodactylus fuscus]|uniref:transcription factor Sox-3-like n=1 Tax=Leptodactylus fuscus TaxID=238119 RepID=UPI003F4EA185
MAEPSTKSPLRESNSQATEAGPPSHERRKMPMNAFNLWCRTARIRLTARYPRVHYRDVGRILGYEWHHLADAEKRPFIEEAQRLKAKYVAEHFRHKYAERKEKELLQNQGFQSVPETPMPSGARPSSNTSAVPQGKENHPCLNSSPSGSCSPRQSGAMQNLVLSNSHIQSLPSYGNNSLHYNHAMPSIQSHVSSSATNNPTPPNTQQSSTTMDRGMDVSVVGKESISSTTPVRPCSQCLFPGEIEDMIAVYLPLDDD